MRFQIGAVILMSLMATACSGIGSANSPGGSGAAIQANGNSPASSNVPNINLAAITASVTTAQTSITNAQSALSQILTSSGGFNFSALIGGVNFGNLGTCVGASFSIGQLLFLPEDIATALTCVLNDVVTVATAAKTDMANATAELNVALLSVPAGSAEATEIQTMITQVTTLETNYSTMVKSLVTQISLASTALGSISTLAASACPIPGLSLICGGAVTLLLEPIQNAITSFQTEMETI